MSNAVIQCYVMQCQCGWLFPGPPCFQSLVAAVWKFRGGGLGSWQEVHAKESVL